MKAYIAAKFKGNDNREFLEGISKVLESLGAETFLFVRDIEKWGQIKLNEKEVMERAKKELQNSDLLVIEFSEPGVGLGIEAGWADAFGKPTIVISKSSYISPTLKGIANHFINYSSLEDLKNKLKPVIEEVRKNP